MLAFFQLKMNVLQRDILRLFCVAVWNSWRTTKYLKCLRHLRHSELSNADRVRPELLHFSPDTWRLLVVKHFVTNTAITMPRIGKLHFLSHLQYKRSQKTFSDSLIKKPRFVQRVTRSPCSPVQQNVDSKKIFHLLWPLPLNIQFVNIGVVIHVSPRGVF